MTSKEFVIWLKGFTQAANTYNITPKQWEVICEELDKVNDKPNTGGYTISTGTGGTYGVINTTAENRSDITYNNEVLSTNTTH